MDIEAELPNPNPCPDPVQNLPKNLCLKTSVAISIPCKFGLKSARLCSLFDFAWWYSRSEVLKHLIRPVQESDVGEPVLHATLACMTLFDQLQCDRCQGRRAQCPPPRSVAIAFAEGLVYVCQQTIGECLVAPKGTRTGDPNLGAS